MNLATPSMMLRQMWAKSVAKMDAQVVAACALYELAESADCRALVAEGMGVVAQVMDLLKELQRRQHLSAGGDPTSSPLRGELVDEADELVQVVRELQRIPHLAGRHLHGKQPRVESGHPRYASDPRIFFPLLACRPGCRSG